MSLVSLLATTTLITMVNSTPLIYADGQRAKVPIDHDQYFLIQLLTHRDMDLQPQLLDERGDEYSVSGSEADGDGDGGGGGGGAGIEGSEASGGHPSHARGKRIGSLSIVNSVDVLRQRVLLELARRKAMEDQRQINENRRILDYVGKRSGYRGRQQRIPRRGRLQYQPEDTDLDLLPRLDRLQ